MATTVVIDLADCPCCGVSSPCCPERPSLPTQLVLQLLVAGSGSCPLDYDAGSDWWAGSGSFTIDNCGDKDISWQLQCQFVDEQSQFFLRWSCDGESSWSPWTAAGLKHANCEPLEFQLDDWSLTSASGCDTCFAPEIHIVEAP